MANSTIGQMNYSSLFTSPLKPHESKPLSNLLYGSATSRIYSNTVAKSLHSTTSQIFGSMKTVATDLKSSSTSLTSKSTVTKKNLTSSDTSSIIGTSSPNATNSSHIINISKLASNQVNKGLELKSDGIATFKVGLNTLDVKVGNTEKSVSFNVGVNSNKEVLDKIASSINTAKLGITATIVSDKTKGTSYMSISSDKTGISSAFSIKDKYNGNATAITGITNVEKVAQNAEFKIDDKNVTSSSNDIKLDNGNTKISLKKATNVNVSIDIKDDTSTIDAEIKHFIEHYNQMVSFANSNSKIGSSNLVNTIDTNFSKNRIDLDRIGISSNTDGTLKIDEKALSKSLTTNITEVKEIFNPNNGFSKKVSDLANEIIARPSKFLNPTKAVSNEYKGLYIDISL